MKKEPAMTEQPPSAEAQALLREVIEACGQAGICRFPPCACAAEIDALIAQRVAAETEWWQNRDRQRLEQIARLQLTVQSFQSATAERPASPQEIIPTPTMKEVGAGILWSFDRECEDAEDCAAEIYHAMSRAYWAYAGRCVRQATAAPVGDHTERARELLCKLHCWRLLYHDAWPIDDPDVGQIAEALSAIADAVAIRAFGQRVWSDTEEVAYQAGVSDTRARLLEPDVREAVRVAIFTVGGWSSTNLHKDKHLTDAAIARITEMLK